MGQNPASHESGEDSIELEPGMETTYVSRGARRRPLRVEEVRDVDVPESIDQGQNVRCSTKKYYRGTTVEMTLYCFHDEIVEEFEQDDSSGGRDDA